jgi:hypothetical protein
VLGITMKKIVALLGSLVLVAALSPQSSPRIEQIRGAAGSSGVLVVIGGKLLRAQLDSSIVLDTSGANPVLSAITPSLERQQYKLTTAQATFNLDKLPKPNSLHVYVSGWLMAEGEDYTVAGNVVTFFGQNSPQAGDVVQFRYFS